MAFAVSETEALTVKKSGADRLEHWKAEPLEKRMVDESSVVNAAAPFTQKKIFQCATSFIGGCKPWWLIFTEYPFQL